MEAPASKVSPATVTVAMRPPTTPLRSNTRISVAGVDSGEYLRRKWATEEPPMPAPMMQTVDDGGGGSSESG